MILDRILQHKKREVSLAKKKKPFKTLRLIVSKMPKKKNSFLAALKKEKEIAIIAEIKKKSPSKGLLSRNFDPARIAKGYKKAGAAALSVLTDKKFFGGSPRFLKEAKTAAGLPVLRKDFIIDEYQIWEARLMGADCVLLIAATLSAAEIERFSRLAKSLGLDALVEVHTEADAEKALRTKARFVGINNRDLRTFRVDLAQTKRLAARFKKNVFLVSESGVQSSKDLLYLKNCGARAVLVGESLMREKDPGRALKKLRG